MGMLCTTPIAALVSVYQKSRAEGSTQEIERAMPTEAEEDQREVQASASSSESSQSATQSSSHLQDAYQEKMLMI